MTLRWWYGYQTTNAIKQPSPPFHRHSLQTLEKLIITFNPPWLTSNLTKFEAVTIKSVGEVPSYARCGNRVTFPTTSRWHYRWVSVCAYVRSQGKPMKFGEDQKMYAKVMSDCVLWQAAASRQSLRVCHGHTLQTLEKILLTFNPRWLKSKHTKFKAVNIKSEGGVGSYARFGCGNRVTFPTTSRWRYSWVSVCAYVCSQGRVPGKPMTFGEDGTMYAKVISDFAFSGEQWQVVKLWGVATDTPFKVWESFARFFIPHGLRVTWPSLKLLAFSV